MFHDEIEALLPVGMHASTRVRAHYEQSLKIDVDIRIPAGAPLLFLLSQMMAHECIIHTCPALIAMHGTVPQRTRARGSSTRKHPNCRRCLPLRCALSITSPHNAPLPLEKKGEP